MVSTSPDMYGQTFFDSIPYLVKSPATMGADTYFTISQPSFAPFLLLKPRRHLLKAVIVGVPYANRLDVQQ